ncbi:hypothetical protein CY35_04G013900 [Sphagnum magellanicum]|nr:hypothetical protein CY35_04G013900 [Sphagnum magellanicum]
MIQLPRLRLSVLFLPLPTLACNPIRQTPLRTFESEYSCTEVLLPLSNAKTHKRREKIEHTCFFVPVLKPVTLLVKNAGLQAATASWQASKSLTLQSRDTHVGKERHTILPITANHFQLVQSLCTILRYKGGIAQHTSNRQHTGDQTALHRIMGGQLSLLQRMDMGLMDARILTILHQDDDVLTNGSSQEYTTSCSCTKDWIETFICFLACSSGISNSNIGTRVCRCQEPASQIFHLE